VSYCWSGFHLFLLRRGYFRSSILIIIGLFFILETVSILSATLRGVAETLLFFTLTILLAGLFLGRRALVIMYTLCVSAVVISAVREQTVALRLEGIVIASNFALLNGLIAVFLDQFGATLRRALISALERENELQKETDGHTQRVTRMTLELARAMQVDETQLIHIRRGALLHDMGKLGIPDHILLKAEKLTDEEWAIMRKHPQFAYELLSSIRYLQPALKIPYCHHEKWDGTGYPRGLRREEIPLEARIFAVVDVWDAL
jgi:HD-GYP domain-containing protein (c-di-GMP phosphodiesterase class II)